ncbi:MAG: TonB-dependent receptor plug domain-containing protein, partial [Bacteroidota bacterium]
ATGSFDLVDNRLLNRSVTTNVLDRIVSLTPGIYVKGTNKTTSDASNVIIRGQSTLFGSTAPLIILDNFPYDGSLQNINPNDIESITILKDAAAASIWGARAGNGVIVITSKKGKLGKHQISLNSNISVQKKPDLWNVNQISSGDFIDQEKFLYSQGYYQKYFASTAYQAITPVVQLLHNVDAGIISSADANAQIDAMKNYDDRNDIYKYLYRTTVNQQYHMDVSGATPNINYFLSVGWDHNLPNLVSQKYDRVSLRSLNSFKLSEKLQADAGLSFIETANKSGNNSGYYLSQGSGSLYPYARLADATGNPLPVNLSYSPQFIQTAQSQGLLNWEYKPLADINTSNNVNSIRDYLVNASLKYQILPFLNAEVRYQFENQIATQNNINSDSSFYARDLINKFTQVSSSGSLTYPIPVGGVQVLSNSELVSHQGRFQIVINKVLNKKHQLTGLAGMEVRSLITTSNSSTNYGYDEDYYTINNSINYTTSYKFYKNIGKGYVPNSLSIDKKTDHFLSYYGNLAYTYDKRYILSA